MPIRNNGVVVVVVVVLVVIVVVVVVVAVVGVVVVVNMKIPSNILARVLSSAAPYSAIQNTLNV
ncbi:hypothetical protein N9L68_09405 [bacterium]|nr:hypothetical protein [bacterium]